MSHKSLLFIPGNTPSMLKNSDLHDADLVILDLEDAVFEDQKDAARHLVSTMMNEAPFLPANVAVRINQVGTGAFESDLSALPLDRIDSLVIPKAEPETIDEVVRALHRLGNHSTSLIALIETPSGLIETQKIASHPRVTGLLLGAEDLTASLFSTRTKSSEEILLARSMVVLSARTHGKNAYDTPWTDTDDLEGLEKDARFARQLGFDGKAAIHPGHIKAINRAFMPTEDEILWAERVMTKAKTHTGAFALDGKMVDEPVIRRARRIMNMASPGKSGGTDD
jgi:citrate lyase subunit beta / citryl-CoA lyase